MNSKWEKSPPELIALFEQIVPSTPLVQKRKMFGFPCAFTNSNMFMGLHQNDLFLRLNEENKNKFIKEYQANLFEPMPGRTMKEYVVVPPSLYEQNLKLDSWIQKSLSYASNLLPKKRKKIAKAK